MDSGFDYAANFSSFACVDLVGRPATEGRAGSIRVVVAELATEQGGLTARPAATAIESAKHPATRTARMSHLLGCCSSMFAIFTTVRRQRSLDRTGGLDHDEGRLGGQGCGP